MKFKLGLLLGAAGGYLFGSGRARKLWAQVKPSKTTSGSSMASNDADRQVDAIIVDLTSSPMETGTR